MTQGGLCMALGKSLATAREEKRDGKNVITGIDSCSPGPPGYLYL